MYCSAEFWIEYDWNHFNKEGYKLCELVRTSTKVFCSTFADCNFFPTDCLTLFARVQVKNEHKAAVCDGGCPEDAAGKKTCDRMVSGGQYAQFSRAAMIAKTFWQTIDECNALAPIPPMTEFHRCFHANLAINKLHGYGDHAGCDPAACPRAPGSTVTGTLSVAAPVTCAAEQRAMDAQDKGRFSVPKLKNLCWGGAGLPYLNVGTKKNEAMPQHGGRQ